MLNILIQMSLIADLNDPSGRGMFSREGRKLNKIFLNLNKTSFGFNQLKNQNPNFFKSDLKKEHKKTQKVAISFDNEPFSFMISRDYLNQIDQHQKSEPVHGHYYPRIIQQKTKSFVNYNKSDHKKLSLISKNSQFNKKNEVPNELTQVCKRMRCHSLQNEKNDNSSFGKNTIINFEKQRPRKLSPKKTFCEYDLKVTEAFYKTKKNDKKMQWYKKSALVTYFSKNNIQRNNYALQIKRDLVDRKTVFNVPDFAKMISRDRKNEEIACLNKEYYDYEKPRKNSRNVFFVGKRINKHEEIYK